jgi:hypothetical protein
MKLPAQLKGPLARIGKIVDQIAAFAVLIVLVFIGTIVLAYVLQSLPTLYQLVSANAQGIVGIAEIMVAITLIFTAIVEGLPFLSAKRESIMHA